MAESRIRDRSDTEEWLRTIRLEVDPFKRSGVRGGRLNVFSAEFLGEVGRVVGAWDIGERRVSTRDRWAIFASAVAAAGSTAGVLTTGRGGLPTLWKSRFSEWHWPRATFLENLSVWATTRPTPLVRMRYGKSARQGGSAPATSVEIPLLTEILIWAARHRREREKYWWCEGIGLTERMVHYLTLEAVRSQAWPPIEIEHPRDFLRLADDVVPPIIKAARLIEEIERSKAEGSPHPLANRLVTFSRSIPKSD